MGLLAGQNACYATKLGTGVEPMRQSRAQQCQGKEEWKKKGRRRERGRERSMMTRRRAILVNRLRDLIPLWIDPILRAYSGTTYHAGAHSRVVIILELLKKTPDSNSM